MSGSGVTAGHQTRINTVREDNGFMADPDTAEPFAPGVNLQLTTAEGSNAVQRVFQPGDRTAIDLIAMVFEGSFTLQFSAVNPWWLAAFLGEAATEDNGDGTYTHSFDDDGSPATLRIIEGYEDTSDERILKGCVVSSMTVDVNIQEEVQVTLQGAYADEELLEDTTLTAQHVPEHTPFTFAEAAISVGGETEGYVQQMSLTVEQEIDLIREMGTRIAVDYNPKVLRPDVNHSRIKDAGENESLKEMYGGDTSPAERVDNSVSVAFSFDNGASDEAVNTLDFEVTGTLTESYDESGIGDPTADLEQTINRTAERVSAEATNNTQEAY